MRTKPHMVWVYRPGRPEPKARRMTNREIEKRERVVRKQIAGRHDRWSDEARCHFWWGEPELSSETHRSSSGAFVSGAGVAVGVWLADMFGWR